MFERFTDTSRRAVVVAQEEARLLNHTYIGTEHILLSLIRTSEERDTVISPVLRKSGLNQSHILPRIQRVGDSAPSGHLPFTPRSKRIFELALREALQLGHNYIGHEHLLLGLIREGEGTAAKIMADVWPLPEWRQRVMAELKIDPPKPLKSVEFGYLFQTGQWTLHSGQTSDFKINCDALATDDIRTIGYRLHQLIAPYRYALGVPQGGLKLAEMMNEWKTGKPEDPVLICDDVYTTGGSLSDFREHVASGAIAVVIFARTPPPEWITPLFTMTQKP